MDEHGVREAQDEPASGETTVADALRVLAEQIDLDRQSSADRSVAILAEVRDLAQGQRSTLERLTSLSDELRDAVGDAVREAMEVALGSLREELVRLEERIHLTVDDRLRVLLDDRLGRLEDTLGEARSPGTPPSAEVRGTAQRGPVDEQVAVIRATLRDELDRRDEYAQRLAEEIVSEVGARVGALLERLEP